MSGPELPEPYRLAAAMRTCGDPDCDQPEHLKKPYRGESGVLDLSDEEVDEFIGVILGLRAGKDLRSRIEEALYASLYPCPRCKVCDRQVDAVMRVLGYA